MADALYQKQLQLKDKGFFLYSSLFFLSFNLTNFKYPYLLTINHSQYIGIFYQIILTIV